MSVDVLLAHAFFLNNDSKQKQEKIKPYPPLATLYAASVLRQADYEVALFDATLATGVASFAEVLERYQPRLLVIYEDSFNFLSKMCLDHVRKATLEMVALSPDVPVIVSSSDASDRAEVYLTSGVDYVLIGEAEQGLRELVDHLLGNSRGSPSDIAGLAVANPAWPKGVQRSLRRKPERHPDVFPFPAWDLVDIEAYRQVWQESHRRFSLNMVTTRGCPYACNWCAKPIWGKQYAVRSPANVAAEMALLKADYGPDHIWFADDIFGLKPHWVAKFADEVNRRRASIPFMIQSRADLINRNVATALAQAGCQEVWLGAESGSQKILDAMDKGIRVDQIVEARRLLKAVGVRTCFFIQFGYPGETYQDILKTVTMIRQTLPDDIGVSVSYPLPGTEFYERVKHELQSKTHWWGKQ